MLDTLHKETMKQGTLLQIWAIWSEEASFVTPDAPVLDSDPVKRSGVQSPTGAPQTGIEPQLQLDTGSEAGVTVSAKPADSPIIGGKNPIHYGFT